MMSREMKHSGIEWIGEIPKEWRVKRIKHSCKLFGRIGFRGYTADDLVNEGEGAITLSPSNMDGIKLDFSHCSYLSWDKYEESPEIKVAVGDVLLVKTASVGKCAYVDNLPMECTVNPQILVLKEHRDCSKFIAYIFQTPLGQAYIDVTKGGTTISTISQEKIGNYEFAFPPISEQQKIANYLDKVCGEVDEMISLQEQMIEELKAYKQSVITEAVTKGLNPNVPIRDSGIDWIGEIPKHWSVERKLSHICNKGISYGIVKLFEPDDINGVKVLRCSDVLEGHISEEKIRTVTKELSQEYKRTILSGGEIVINVRGTLGGCAVVPYSMRGYNIAREVALVDTRNINNYYLMYFFLSNVFHNYRNRYLAGCIYVGLNIEMLSACPVIIPPIEEQQSIASYLDTKCAEIDALIAIKQAKIEELKEYKKSVIYEYVTGKKEVV